MFLLAYLLTRLLTYLLTYLLTCLLTYLHTCLLTYIHTYLIAYLLTYLLNYLLTYLHTYILISLLTYLHTYIHTYLLTYLFTYLITYLLTYLHTYVFINLLTYLLTPWNRVLFEKLTGLQVVKKFPAFYGTRKFITAITSTSHLFLSWARSIQSMSPHVTSWRSILILSSHLRLGLLSCLVALSFPTKTPNTTFLSPKRATCPAYLILLDVITRTIFGEQYRSLSSLICSVSLKTSVIDNNNNIIRNRCQYLRNIHARFTCTFTFLLFLFPSLPPIILLWISPLNLLQFGHEV